MKQLDALDAWIEEEMKKRGFLPNPHKQGHWRSAAHAGHPKEFEFRHRTIRRWIAPLWAADDIDAARKKLDGEVSALVNGCREGDFTYEATAKGRLAAKAEAEKYDGPPIGTEKL